MPGLSLEIKYSQFFDKNFLARKMKPAERKYLRRAGSNVRLAARQSIKKKGGARKPPKNRQGKAYQRWLEELRTRPASPPGAPPFTHTELFRDAIVFGLDFATEEVAVVGFLKDKIDDLGELHEFGGTRKGRRYPPRPTMGPALEKIEPNLPRYWAEAYG